MSFVDPIRQAWQDEGFRQMSSSFEGFCVMLGLQDVGPYMHAQNAISIEDWTSIPLDAQGRQIQEEMTKKFQVRISFGCLNTSNLVRHFH